MMLQTQSAVVRQRQYFEHPRTQLMQRTGEAFTSDVSSENSRDTMELSTASKGDGKSLSTPLLLGLMYTYALGGAYGIEESVMGGGPLLTIVSIILIPIFMGFPIALVVTEMTTAISSNAASLMWINVAFHRVVYFAMVIMSLLFNFVDNSIFPVLASDYLCTSLTCTDLTAKLIRVAMIVVAYVLNVIGVQAVGVVGLILTISTVTPFFVMFLIHLLTKQFYLNWPAISNIPSNVDWATFLTTVSWNLCGIEQVGTLAEDIQMPHKTILRALLQLLGLAYITYIPTILTGVSVTKGLPDYEDWTTGYWTHVAYDVGGSPLQAIILMGGVLSAFGQIMSALCTTTQIIAGVAFTGVFPGVIGRVLTQRNKRFGTYHWTLTINALITGLFCTLLDFGPLVKMDQVLYGIRVVMVFSSFLVLRYRYPDLHRPFKVPLSGYKLAVFLVPVIFYIALIIITLVGDTETLIMTAGIVGGSVVVSALYCFLVRKDGFSGRIVSTDVVDEETESLIFRWGKQ